MSDGYLQALTRSLVILIGGAVVALNSFARGEPWLPGLAVCFVLTALHAAFVSYLWLRLQRRTHR